MDALCVRLMLHLHFVDKEAPPDLCSEDTGVSTMELKEMYTSRIRFAEARTGETGISDGTTSSTV